MQESQISAPVLLCEMEMIIPTPFVVETTRTICSAESITNNIVYKLAHFKENL